MIGRRTPDSAGQGMTTASEEQMSSLVIGLIVVYAVFFVLIHTIVTWRGAK